MEFLDGVTLDEVMWEGLTVEARIKIYDKISEQLRVLRSIPPPNPAYYGRVNHQPYYPLTGMIYYRQRDLPGPFYSYTAWLEQAYRTFELAFINYHNTRLPHESGKTHPSTQLFAACFKPCLDNVESGKPKLTHMDIKLENMIVVPSASNPSDKLEDYDLWLVDWETLAWMPSWAQTAAAMSSLPISDTEEKMMAEWRISYGIEPFYIAQASFWFEAMRSCGSGGGV
jgi:hypothetical protein